MGRVAWAALPGLHAAQGVGTGAGVETHLTALAAARRKAFPVSRAECRQRARRGRADHAGKVTGSQRPPRRVRCQSLTAPPPQATPSTVPFLAVLPKHGVLGLISVELLDVAKAGLGLDARLLQELKLLPYFIMALHGFINAEPALGLWLGAAPQRGSQGKCLYFLGPP